MSCNGCRVLRKGCSENCILRPCLQWIDGAEAQGHATVFVAKFFGRAGLMSFISAVPETERPALFHSLLFEAAGRTVNPVNGAVGLLGSGNWHICQEAVGTVLRGGSLRSIQGFVTVVPPEQASEVCADIYKLPNPSFSSRPKLQQRERQKKRAFAGLDLSLTPGFPVKPSHSPPQEKQRLESPSMNSEESVTTMCFESDIGGHHQGQAWEPKLLDLFH